VLIVEARQDRSFLFGTSFLCPSTADKGDGTRGRELNRGGLGDLVIQIMKLGRANIDATLSAAASRGDVEIVRARCSLRQQSRGAVLVGSQLHSCSQSQLPHDTPQRDQVIQYRDVGTKLTVRPRLNQDG